MAPPRSVVAEPVGSLGLDAPTDRRFVEVAIDAAGGGGNRTYTYHLPDRLSDIVPGEAVLVEYGRRQALAVVLGRAPPQPAWRQSRSWNASGPTGRCSRR